MAEQTHDLRFNFIAKTQAFTRAMGKVEGRLKTFSTNVGRIGTTLSTRLTLPLAIAGGAAFKMAADFQESLNKVDVSFKSSAGEVRKFSQTALRELGLSQAQALETAALFGDMGTGMGQTTAEAAKMATSLTALAADLSSFKNIQQEVAQTALKSIFTGETESLKNLGIVMTETNLKEFARQQGIQKSIKDMSQLEKVELRYQFVMQKTQNAQGDFARTSGSASNKLRTLQNTMIELGTKIGQILIPPITLLLDKLTSLANQFLALDNTTKAQVITAAALAAALGPVLLVLSSISAVIAFMLSPLGLVISALAVLGAGFIYVKDNWEAVKERLSDWSWWKNMLISMIQFFVKNNPFNLVIKGINAVLSYMGKNPIPNPFEKFSDEYLENLKDANKEYEHEFGSFGDAIKNQFSSLKSVLDGLGKLFGFSGTAPSGSESGGGEGGVITKTNEEVEELNNKFNELATGILPQVGEALKEGFNSIMEGEDPIKRMGTILKALIKRLLVAAAAAMILGGILGAGGAAATNPNSLLNQLGGVMGIFKTLGGFAFANGGIVSGPTTALIGEYPGARSNPEVVAPLSKLKTMLGTSGAMQGEFVLRGQDLVVALQRAERNRNRFK